MVHAWWVGCWWVDGAIAVQLYCCCTVLLLLSPAAACLPGRSRRRSRLRSRAATVARASLGCRRRSPAVARSLDRSLARRRSPAAAAVARAAFGRHRRSPAVARSFARPPSFVRSPAVARPPSLLYVCMSYPLYSSSFENMCRWGIAESSSRENMYVQMSYRL